jgi:DNA-binding HxlR family transcriptional regulator
MVSVIIARIAKVVKRLNINNMKAIKNRLVESLMELNTKAEKGQLNRTELSAIDYYCELLKKAQSACEIIHKMREWEDKENARLEAEAYNDVEDIVIPAQPQPMPQQPTYQSNPLNQRMI